MHNCSAHQAKPALTRAVEHLFWWRRQAIQILRMSESQALPLYVDLDGTLIHGDSLIETFLLLISLRPWALFLCPLWLCQGKVYFKNKIAGLLADALPSYRFAYRQDFIAYLKAESGKGRLLYLFSAADWRIVQAVQAQLGLFAEARGTTLAGTNLAGQAKLQSIQGHAAQRGHTAWAYAGDSRVDLPIWHQAQEIVAVGVGQKVLRQLQALNKPITHFAWQGAGVLTWLKMLRIQQWAKNLLLFAPLLASHSLNLGKWQAACIAFLAFGLCACATYVFNDLLDLSHDRQHRIKQHRPLAAGRIDALAAAASAVLLWLAGMALAAMLEGTFVLWLAFYCVITWAYSLKLKRVALLDVGTLSALYTLRLFAGAAACQIALSNWLLAFSMFLFLSLALVKRCAELQELQATQGDSANTAPGRGYAREDLHALRSMGIASAFLSVLVLALYIESQNGRLLYATPHWLWGLPPLMMLWTMRIWLLAGRRQLKNEDPLKHAISDPWSWWILLAMMALAWLAKGGVA